MVKHHQVVKQQLSIMTLCGALCLVIYRPPMNQEYSSSGGSAGYKFNQHIDVKAPSDDLFLNLATWELAGLQETQIVQISNATLPAAH